jgi:hypothetical protein
MGSLLLPSVNFLGLSVSAQPALDDVRDYNRFKNLTPERDLF